ncbi:MAG: Glutathione transport system permease protein GsiC [Alphaproteobacteria bacterium MarineAlpha3_Bin4]|nr:MAG: Glutathione transport system permease protein GsiC [Alphaproteobacteria bacterium MarineAlpha3_Bin4]
MYKYILKRIFLMVPTLIGAAVLVFFLLRLIPGDVCELRLAGTGLYADPADILLCRQKLGLEDPILVQFYDFVVGFFILDLGDSMWTGKPITFEIGLRFQLSLQVAFMATFVAVIISIPLGAISAIKQDTWIDYVVRAFSIFGIAIPSFWLGIMIILGLLIYTQIWFGEPWMPPIWYVSPFEDPISNMSQLIWPSVATGYRYSAVATRMTRSALLEVLREDYIRTARAKGLMEKIIINRHALKNSLLPVVTVIGIEFAFLMGGLVVTEQVFNLNGLGKLFVESVLNNDYSMTQALVMIVVAVFVFTNFVVDLFYAWLDPRIRYA